MQRWPRRTLPTNLIPIGTRCIQIIIPDDDDWERDMYAEIVTLAQWMRWERDLGKNGKPVADIWLKSLKTWRHCDGSPSPIHGMEVEEDMPIRIDCDCNVFVTCCDGTEKQILTSGQVQALINSQPGTGSGVPAPGECQSYPVRLPSNGAWFNPALVNTGDVLTLTSLDGATTDVAPIGRWNCPDGSLFFGGTCTGGPNFDAGALAPSLPIGIPLYAIGGSYYDARTAFTVPGGITNLICAIVVNYAPGGDFAGELTATMTDCNNAAAAWSSFFDFTINDYSSLINLQFGNFVPGTGYVGTFASGTQQSFTAFLFLATGVNINNMTMHYDCAGHSGGSQILAFVQNSGYFGTPTTPTTGTDLIFGQVENATADNPGCQVGSGGDAGPVNIINLLVTGVGAKPAGWP